MRIFKITSILVGITIFLLGVLLFYRHYMDLRKSNARYKTSMICHQCISNDSTIESIRSCTEYFEGEVREFSDNRSENKRAKDLGHRSFAILDSFLGFEITGCTITLERGKIVEIRYIGPNF